MRHTIAQHISGSACAFSVVIGGLLLGGVLVIYWQAIVYALGLTAEVSPRWAAPNACTHPESHGANLGHDIQMLLPVLESSVWHVAASAQTSDPLIHQVHVCRCCSAVCMDAMVFRFVAHPIYSRRDASQCFGAAP